MNVSKHFEETKINSPKFTKTLSHKSNNIDEVNVSVNDIIPDTSQKDDSATF